MEEANEEEKNMKILYGTTNKGKLQAMKKAVETLDIELIGLGDIDSELPYINEKNAVRKCRDESKSIL